MSENVADKRLTSKQEKALIALLSTNTTAAAAEQAGVSSKTIERWLRDEDFVREYRVVRSQVMETAVARIQHAATEAVEALRRNLVPPASPSVQIRAAVSILEFSLKGVEFYDLVQRVDELYRAREEN
jgi:phage terminase small subunit